MTVSNNETPWYERGACKDKSEYFFTEHLPLRESRKLDTIAKSICASCSVSGECLQYAIDNNEEYGIWGGIKAKDLKKMSISIKRMDENVKY